MRSSATARTPTESGTRILHSACPLDCPDACSLDVEVSEGRVVRLDGNHVNPLTEGYICGKVRDYARHVYHPTRLTQPMLRAGPKGAGEWRGISWDEAYEHVARELGTARDRFGGESILPVFYGGSNGKLTQGASDARFFRRLGASRLKLTVCAAATTAASTGLYGRMPGVAFEDFDEARLIVVWGANPAASGIHLVPVLERARARGARLVVIDPRRTKVAKRADMHLAPHPGTDLVLALALIRWLFREGHADEAFLSEHCTGAEELRARAEPWSLEAAADVCRLTPDEIEALARIYAESSPALVRCGWGLERNRNGGSAVAAVLALPAVAGKFGVRAGGFTLSNGAYWSLANGVSEPEAETRSINMNRLGRALTGELDLDPRIACAFVYNANPLATFPDQERIRRGLAREDLFTVVFEQVMTDTARLADLVLPATTFLEHTELRAGYGATGLQLAGPVIAPVGEARPNYEVFAELSRRLGLAESGDDEDPRRLSLAALGGDEALLDRLERDGIATPEHPRRVLFVDTFPGTPDRKVHLLPAGLDEEAGGALYRYRPDPSSRNPGAAGSAQELALISPCTEKRVSSSLGELHEGLVSLALHPRDARARGIADGDEVRIWNELGEVHTTARIDPDLKVGVAFLPKGLWSHNTRNGRTANALAPDTLTDVAGGACFNDSRVFIEPRTRDSRSSRRKV